MTRQEFQKPQNMDFGKEISKILPLFMKEFARRQNNIFAKGLMTIPQVVILDLLLERGSCKMNELAKALGLTMSAVTVIIDKMIVLKLVKRERSEQDRRVVKTSLLNKGKEMIRRINQGRQNIVNDLFSVLTESEKSEYIKMLRKIGDSLKQRQ